MCDNIYQWLHLSGLQKNNRTWSLLQNNIIMGKGLWQLKHYFIDFRIRLFSNNKIQCHSYWVLLSFSLALFYLLMSRDLSQTSTNSERFYEAGTTAYQLPSLLHYKCRTLRNLKPGNTSKTYSIIAQLILSCKAHAFMLHSVYRYTRLLEL